MNFPEQERNKDIPENDPSKPMDSKKEVEQSPDEKTDQDFPGYPHYPSREDMMDKRTDSHRVDVDIEKIPGGQNKTGVDQRYITNKSKDTGNSGGSENLDLLNSKQEEIGKPQNRTNDDQDRQSQ